MKSQSENYVVEMLNISKSFPGVKALDNVTLRLKAGEVHALVGENGAGKSTMMNVLTGQFMMDDGTILFEGKPVRFSSPRESKNKNIILVPQELNLVNEASVAENVFLGNEKMKGVFIDWKKAKEEAEKLLAKLDVHIDVSKPVKELTAAYQQLVSVARALAYEPKVLILDESTAVLTNKEKTSLFDTVKKLKENGTAIVFITHHLDEVMSECDTVTIMRNGCHIRDCMISDITKDEMINLMAGHEVKKTKRVARNIGNDVFFKAENITRYGDFENLSFDVKKGEILCVAGLVGAGRTEIFKAVFGITLKDSGKTYIEGKEVNIKGPRDAIKYGMGYVSEERRTDGITPELSVTENMMIPSYDKLKKYGLIDFKKTYELTDKYIDKFAIKTPTREALIKNLSGGNQQKVIVARWMAKDVKMLILDEPTRGIDVNAKGEIHDFIRELADNGVSIVVISSEMEEILALADRIMVIHDHKIVGFLDDVSNLTEEDVLKVAFK